MSPLALVTHAANNKQAVTMAHHRLMAPAFGQVPNLVTQEIEQRMIEYLKLIQCKKESNSMGAIDAMSFPTHHHPHQNQEQQERSDSPEASTREALNALEMSRVALWQMYHNNTSPPISVNVSPRSGGSAHNISNGHGTTNEEIERYVKENIYYF